ncbi:BAG family molecular chaperone regulator 3-like [Solanum stenotomum]|uniref:BAG family molecular chaperone regulator 3-like n=1 Tax=Solanum stenotomum TaxID=172797 RepID=UPI0020D124E1|nr:BAG family molecular chaperone regulator 3-like [Solanum stenotomum]
MIKLRSKRFPRRVKSNSTINNNGGGIKWELRPGGMLVQKRECENNVSNSNGEAIVKLRVSTVSNFHDISIQPTSTFGELKMMLSIVTGLEPKEQRLLFRGKEREDYEHLHMVGVRDKDKLLLFLSNH